MAKSAETQPGTRREQARERAKALQSKRRRREQTARAFTIGGILLAAAAVVAVVVFVIVSGIRPAGQGPQNMASNGIVIGQDFVAERTDSVEVGADPIATSDRDDVVQIVLYVDYICPGCGAFEAANAATIEQFVQQGIATVEYHPVSVLDRYSLGSKYSTRAANAAACVADISPDTFFAYNRLLFDNQPPEGSTGLDDSELIALADQAGAESMQNIETCVTEGTFNSWVQASTSLAFSEPIPGTDGETITGTPAVFVNGSRYQGSRNDAAGFQAFVLAAAGQNPGGETSAPSEPEPTEPAEEEPAEEEPAP
ncbi:DsbA family protein [Humidisolicoccus flavus]|uniref:DsbA family protein n=1 Tax=Humidisolicoccus flavus TaxID=3111414 RepID=UPI003251D32B